MADYKISQLTSADALSDANLFEVVQTLSNRKGTFAQVKTWIQSWITKAMVGLGNVDNIASNAMPVSAAQQAALDLKANTSALALYLTIANAGSTYIPLSQKGAANGVTPLGSDSKIAAIYLPSYVDDVLEYAAKSSFPATGESGKMYVDTSTNKVWRWSGSTYIEISASPGSTDAVPEGAGNLYFTNARAVAALTGTLANYLSISSANATYMPRSGGTFSGAVAVPAGFTVLAQGGDWGGFISLTKAPNGSLTSPTILQYQDKLLFFENGGSGRGAYLNWGALSSWANNKILTTSDLSGYATQSYVQTAVAAAASSSFDEGSVGFSGSTRTIAPVGGNRYLVEAPANGLGTLVVTLPLATPAPVHGDVFEIVLGQYDITTLTVDTSGGRYPIRPAMTAAELNSKRAIKLRLSKSTNYSDALTGWYRE